MLDLTWESLIYSLVILLTAMPVHECAHGLIASKLGDDTARMQGRLTLNPLKHLDVFGSILLVSVGVGWAKPVEVDMRNFKNPRRDMALSSLAGPVSNVLMAYVFMVFYKFVWFSVPTLGFGVFGVHLLNIIGAIIFINIRLAVFNFLPVPPLDGSKIIGGVLPERLYWAMLRYQRQISVVFMLLLISSNVFTAFNVFAPLNWLSDKIMSLLDVLTMPIDLIFAR